MRKVTKVFATIPPVLQEQRCRNLIAETLTQQGGHDFKTDMYGHPKVREALDLIYKSKCAFCETDTSAGATMQVEHYRPKAKVTAKGKPNELGYYWLGYEWSNLLLACGSCNRRKSTQFPIRGQRIVGHPLPLLNNELDRSLCLITHNQLVDEQPLLINPEVDSDPMQHFEFTGSGEINGLTEAGQITIRVCYLDRPALTAKRMKYVYNRIFNKLLKYMERYQDGRITIQKLQNHLETTIEDLVDYASDETNQYIEFALTCLNQFDRFFIQKFPNPVHQQLIRQTYQTLML